MPRGEAINTNLIVVGLTRPGLDPTTYRTGDEHDNRNTTDAVHIDMIDDKLKKYIFLISKKNLFLQLIAYCS